MSAMSIQELSDYMIYSKSWQTHRGIKQPRFA